MRADQHAEQCGLARPVGADDADGFVGADRKVDAVERHKRVEALVDPLGFEQRFAGLERHVRSQASRSAVVGQQFRCDRHVGIGDMLGDDVIELELASRRRLHPLGADDERSGGAQTIGEML